MKRHVVMFVGCAALLCMSSAAQSGVKGTYASINAGLASLNDGDMKIPASEIVFGHGAIEIASDPGVALTGALGYDFGCNVRMEAEVAYQQNDVDQFSVAGTGLNAKGQGSGETTSTSGLLNGYYDFVNASALTPFLSAGIGFTKVDFDDATLGKADGTAMAYQVGAGLGYAVNPMLSLDLKYRYFAAVDLSMDNDIIAGEFEYSSHNVYGGIRASF